ncbi:MAG: peptide chain release factor N(5)-glutamine methyltransferase [Kiritimatiellae bacterium]|nr:peptide chain release factor N(5)-glutamine methyltransferase [Kiritimatiellia bacterium]
MSDGDKTLRELVDLGSRYLDGKGIPESRNILELLAARLFSCGKLELYRVWETVPDTRIVDALRRGMTRVAKGEPVQYVLGQWDFRNLSLKVDRRCLIPRPETEQLVELVLQSPQAKAPGKPIVVDAGTGSGCIILSLAKEMRDGVFVGVDISADALAIARENAQRAGLQERVIFAESDGCGEFDPASVDILVSNPPYIPSREVDRLDPWIRDQEPRLALDGGEDGLDYYRAFINDAVMVLKPGGGLFFEIGDEQGNAVRTLLEDFGFSNVRILPDYAGKDRFALAEQVV